MFESGKEGYDTFRIPAICAARDGTLLAFAEARKDTAKDWGAIDIVLKRSSDGGKTWTPLQVVVSDGNTCGNPQPVLNRKNGDIILVYSWNFETDNERAIILKRSKLSRRVFTVKSTDSGKTWSEPAEITSSVKPENATWFASGPGGAIQIKGGKYDGRIIAPFNVVLYPDFEYRAGALISDDGGDTWRRGTFVDAYDVNESQIAQADGDTLVINMRVKRYPSKLSQKEKELKDSSETPFRKIAISKDGGETWGNSAFDDELPDPICEGAIEAMDTPKGRILCFSNAADTKERKNMTLKIADAKKYVSWCERGTPQNDSSKRWPRQISINKERSAYSDLAALPSGKIAMLYEYGSPTHKYAGIRFVLAGDFGE